MTCPTIIISHFIAMDIGPYLYSSFKLINSHRPPNLNWFLAHLRPCRFNATNWCLSGRISLVHTGWWICRWGWSIWYHKSQIRTSNAYLASIALPTDRPTLAKSFSTPPLLDVLLLLFANFLFYNAGQANWNSYSRVNNSMHFRGHFSSSFINQTRLLTFVTHNVAIVDGQQFLPLPPYSHTNWFYISVPAWLPTNPFGDYRCHWSFANLHGTLMNQHRCGQIKNLKAVICCDIKSHVHGDAAGGRGICRKFACKIADLPAVGQ